MRDYAVNPTPFPWPPEVVGQRIPYWKQRAVSRFNTMWIKQEGRCHYCTVNMTRSTDVRARGRVTMGNMATEDHVLPRSRGGKHNRANLVLACSTCNRNKGNMTEEEFLTKHAKKLAKTKAFHEHERRKQEEARRKSP